MSSRESIVGKKFGRLLVLERLENHISPCGHMITRYRCLCKCNKECNKFRSQLNSHSQCPTCSWQNSGKERARTNQQYLDELFKLHPTIKPLEPYTAIKKKIKHKCMVCGYGNSGEWLMKPSDLLRGYGCPVCSGRIIGSPPEYKNSIWSSEYKEYFSQFLTEEQMKSTSPSCAKKIDATCPLCKRHKFITPGNLKNGLGCVCEDGISYPEKFVYAFFQQMDIEFEYHKTFEWSKTKRRAKEYDFYIPSINTIVEIHGKQHYCGFGRFQQLEEIQNNDAFKQELALCNGIDHYIVIDCSRSEPSFIIDNIISSKLLNLLKVNSDKIDWGMCSLFAVKSFVQTVADYWNDGLIISDIVKRLKICSETVITYLKQATGAGICDYTPQKSIDRTNKKIVGRNHARSKPIYCIELNMVFYDGANFVADKTKIALASNISTSCRLHKRSAGKHPITKEKLHWLYLDYAIQNGYISKEAAETQSNIDNIKILKEMILNNTK